MTFTDIASRIQRTIRESRHYADIKSIAIFGSYARGEATPDSDLDILIEFEPAAVIGLDFFDIQAELEKSLEKKIDLVPRDAVKPFLRDEIYGSAKLVYEK